MFELYTIKAPSSNYFDEMLVILDILDEHCLTFTNEDSSHDGYKRKSLSDEAFDNI
jgi:hypothetical protein